MENVFKEPRWILQFRKAVLGRKGCLISLWFLLNENCSGYLDLLPRQNYWDPTFGRWPTHTVSKYIIYQLYCSVFFLICLNPDPSNINILQEPQIPIGKLCPENWKYFQGSCYLLRNQVKYHSSYFSQHFAISHLVSLSHVCPSKLCTISKPATFSL